MEEKPQSNRTTVVLDIISFLSRFGLAATWIWAGFHKVGSVLETGQSIQAYKIFTLEWSVFLAQIIGPLELMGGFILLIGVFFPAGRLAVNHRVDAVHHRYWPSMGARPW